jgi:ABC-type antimicrobial peptide transport system permease subunit
VLSYDITQRTREIGIRMALGARRSEMVGLVLRDAGVVVITGTILGVAGAWGLARFIRSLLYDVSATDPVTFTAVALLVLVVAFAASLIPGRRAAAVDPVRALRAE